MIKTIFQEISNTYHISKPKIERFFPNPLCFCVHFRSVSLIHSALQWNAATPRKVLAPFSVSHVIAIDSCSLLSLSFFLFLDFIAISNYVFNNRNNYSTRTCRISNNYASRWLATTSSAPSLYANLRVPTRVCDFEGGAIFSKNSTFVFFDGAAWTPRLRSPSPIMAPAIA